MLSSLGNQQGKVKLESILIHIYNHDDLLDVRMAKALLYYDQSSKPGDIYAFHSLVGIRIASHFTNFDAGFEQNRQKSNCQYASSMLEVIDESKAGLH